MCQPHLYLRVGRTNLARCQKCEKVIFRDAEIKSAKKFVERPKV